MKHDLLQQYFTQHRSHYSEDFRLRIHRALSWLQKAEQSDDDLDSRFIFLWISFNAAYAKDLGSSMRSADKGSFVEFINRICHFDHQQNIYSSVWNTFAGSIRILLDNKFTFQDFWNFHNGLISERSWEESFAQHKKKALHALTDKNTAELLVCLFNQLYTVRNQIIHGGATYNSSVNRHQVKDACNILMILIPEMLMIMLLHPNEKSWGKPFYPVKN
ncbi:HEPN domain-containing protein [Acinetobacter haemolyticus]|uniref:HEPN domain-containing protein n=1 Tax=Acinetobacter haemolyticus TaxID=29430 RepID=UPI000C2C0FD1|nr:HEPN domain-containing protein [Acinetobacter haemolyticus]ATZ66799.1 hypothetical protein BSR56_05150 [Acinetobacter haemolyticus]